MNARRAARRTTVHALAWAAFVGCVPDTDPATDPPVTVDTPVDTTDSSPPDSPDTTDTLDTTDTVDPPDPGCGGVLPSPAAAVATPMARAFATEVLDRGERSPCVWIEDLDGDGITDYGWFSTQGDVVWFHWGGPEPTLTSFPLPPGAMARNGSCTLFDRDDDGDLDIVFTGNSEAEALVQVSPRTVELQRDLATLPPDMWGPQWLAAIDLDGSGPLDLLSGFYGERFEACVAPNSVTAPDTTTVLRSGAAICMIADEHGHYTPDDGSHCPAPVLKTPTPMCNSVSLSDLNGDGTTDAFFSGDYAPNELVPGLPGGGFGRGPGAVGVEVFNHAMGSAVADFDGDGRLDLFVTDAGTNDLYAQITCGQFFQLSFAVGLDHLTGNAVTWGVSTRDFDHNGAPDLLIGNSLEVSDPNATGSLCELADVLPYPPSLLLLNDGAAHFTRVDVPDLTPTPRSAWFGGVRMATGDMDDDGDDDAIVSTTFGTTLLRNDLPPVGAWLRVRPLDADGQPALGARVIARQADGGRVVDLWSDYGFSGHSEMTAAFGFAVDAPVTVEVRWPDGVSTTLADLPTGQRVVVRRP